MNNFKPKTLFLGKNLIYLPSCHSTNDIAHEIIQNKQGFDGTIVITDNQTAGRGQRGNSWEAQPNQNITFSVILKPNFLIPTQQFQLNMAVSLAVKEFLSVYLPSEKFSNQLKIKWPNDLYFGNKKIGGILIENSISASSINNSIIGIGLNINQLGFNDNKATSIRAILNSNEISLQKMIEELCEFLEKYYLQLKNGGQILQKKMYLENLFWINETHQFTAFGEDFSGTIKGINEVGMLEIEVNNTIRTFGFKEVSFLITN